MISNCKLYPIDNFVQCYSIQVVVPFPIMACSFSVYCFSGSLLEYISFLFYKLYFCDTRCEFYLCALPRACNILFWTQLKLKMDHFCQNCSAGWIGRLFHICLRLRGAAAVRPRCGADRPRKSTAV